MKIYLLDTGDTNEINVGFDSNICVGGNIEEFKHFKYSAPKEYITSKGKMHLHVLTFMDLNDERRAIVNSVLSNYIEPMDEKRTCIVDILNAFSDYFSKKDIDFVLEKLIGDIGEIIFILKLQFQNIDYSKYYQLEDFSLYDFCFNGNYVDVKTTTTAKKTIFMSKRQLEEGEKVKFFVCEINKIPKQKNIIDLIKLINFKTKTIKNKLEYWLEKYKLYSDVIDSWTVNPENVVSYFVNDDVIPSVDVVRNGGLIDMQLKISVASAEKQGIIEIKKMLGKNN